MCLICERPIIRWRLATFLVECRSGISSPIARNREIPAKVQFFAEEMDHIEEIPAKAQLFLAGTSTGGA